MTTKTRTFYFMRLTGNSLTVFISHRYHFSTQHPDVPYWGRERYTRTEKGPMGALEPIQIAALMRRAIHYATPTRCGSFAGDFDTAALEGWIKQRGNKAWFTVNSNSATENDH